MRSLAGFAGWVTHAGVVGLLESARLVDVAPWLTWRVPSPHALLITAYYLSVLVARSCCSQVGEAGGDRGGVAVLDRRRAADLGARVR